MSQSRKMYVVKTQRSHLPDCNSKYKSNDQIFLTKPKQIIFGVLSTTMFSQVIECELMKESNFLDLNLPDKIF